MKKTDVTFNGVAMVQLDCDNDHVLYQKGSDDYTIRRHARVKPEEVDSYEELTLAERDAIVLERYREAEYKRRLSAAIHERYSIDDEIALGANANSPSLLADEAASADFAQEYAAYQEYRAACKRRIRAEVAAISEVPEEGAGV